MRSRKASLAILLALAWRSCLPRVSFFIAGTSLVWHPSIPIALVVLAIAQIGVHLVFFLHITTGPDNVNNVLALAFGVLIVFLLIVGSLWIMYNLNQNMGRCTCRWASRAQREKWSARSDEAAIRSAFINECGGLLNG